MINVIKRKYQNRHARKGEAEKTPGEKALTWLERCSYQPRNMCGHHNRQNSVQRAFIWGHQKPRTQKEQSLTNTLISDFSELRENRFLMIKGAQFVALPHCCYGKQYLSPIG